MSEVYEFLKQFSESLENKVKEIDPENRVLISYANTITTIDELQSNDLENLAFTISTDKRYDACLRSMITETRQCVYNGFSGYIEYDGKQIDVNVVYTINDAYQLIIIHISDSFDRLMKNFDKIHETACNTKFEFNDEKEKQSAEQPTQYQEIRNRTNFSNAQLDLAKADIEDYCKNVFSQQEIHDKFIERQYVAQGKICKIMHDPDGLLTEEEARDELAEEIFEENAQGDEA